MARTSRQEEQSVLTNVKQPSWTIAVYIRLSREDGNDESESVVNQKKILAEFVEQYFDDRYVVVDFYVDDGLTGTDDTRRDFMRMIADIEDGSVNCVICKTLSRAFRNHADQGYYIEEYFVQKNVRFISTGNPQVDTYLNPEAITGLEVPITGLMNDRFAAKTSADVRRTFDYKRRNGEFIGAFAPYGYLKDPDNKNKLILDEEVLPVKRDMMHWFIHSGMTLAGIAKRLNELGVINPTAYKRSQGLNYCNPSTEICDGLWVGSTVRRMLSDQTNLGHMVQGKQRVVSYKVHDRVTTAPDEWYIVKNTHEPTYTQEEFDTAQRLLQRDTRAPQGEKKVYLFAGFVRCADCNKALRRNPSKGGLVYYNCRTYVEKSKAHCTRHSIREDKLKALVLVAIQTQIALLDELTDIVQQVNHSAQADSSKHIEKMLQEKQREKIRIRALKDGLYEDYKAGDLDREDYRHMKAKYDLQSQQIAQVIANLEEESCRSAKETERENNALALFLAQKNIQQLDRALLVELVDTIYVYAHKEIAVVFRFQSELVRLQEFAKANKAIAT